VILLEWVAGAIRRTSDFIKEAIVVDAGVLIIAAAIGVAWAQKFEGDQIAGLVLFPIAAMALLGFTVFIVNLIRVPIEMIADGRHENEQLKARLDRYNAIGFSVDTQVENVGWFNQDLNDGGGGTVDVVLFVRVQNSGPTSNFTAQIDSVSGVPTSWGSNYTVEPLWWGKSAATTEVPRGMSRRIQVASVTTAAQFFFWTSELGDERPGHQFKFGPGGVKVIEFDLKILERSNDQLKTYRASISISSELSTDFSLEEIVSGIDE